MLPKLWTTGQLSKDYEWRKKPYLDIGGVDLSQEDLLRFQTAQFAQLLLQACVLLVHVQPKAVSDWSGPVQLDDCGRSAATTQLSWASLLKHRKLFFKRRSAALRTRDLQVHWAVHGQRQGQEVEGVKAGTDVSAHLALHLGLELAMEEVHHDGAVSPQVVLPRLWQWMHKHRRLWRLQQDHSGRKLWAAAARAARQSKGWQFSFPGK